MNMNINSKNGFSLVEILVVVSIISVMLGGIFVVFSAGESSWFTAEAGIALQESLRRTLDHVTMELRQSKTSQIQVFDGTGLNSSDIIRFSIPVICHNGDTLLDGSGDVAQWGATLRWGCRDAACMDADDSCTTADYEYIEYRLDAGDRLVRRVLDGNLDEVREDIFANNMTDFQITNGPVLSIQATARVPTAMNRVLTAQTTTSLFVRN